MKPETMQLLKNLGFGSVCLLTVAALLWGTWHVVRLPLFTINQVVVTGGETISHDVIKADVEQLLEGQYMEFIPRQFAYTYPQTEIIEQLSATPRVKNPQIRREGVVLLVEVAEFEPVGLWCDSDQAASSPCVFLDETGYGFAQAPQLAGGAYTRFVRVGEPAITGDAFADSADFLELQTLQSLLAEYGWPVARIEFDQAGDAFVYLVGDSELKVSLRISPAETIDNISAVVASEEYKHFEPGNFAYIDLRFGNKVFVSEFGDPNAEILPEGTIATSSVESAAEIE